VLKAHGIGPTREARIEVGELAAAMSAELDEVAHRLTDAIHSHLDELDDDLHVMTLQSVRSNLGMLMTMLRERSDPATAVAPREALAYAREYARRGLPFELLAYAYRTAQGALSRLWLDRLRESTDDADHLVDGIGFFNDWLFAWIEALERQLTEVYLAEREQWLRGAAAMRAEEVRALLDGARVDVPVVSRRLGYELDRPHVGFVVWSDDEDGDRQERFRAMEQLASAVAAIVGGGGMLAVPQGSQLVCWTGPRPARRAPPELEPDLHVALGGVHRGVAGFALTHREALAARRVARRTGAAWTEFGDVALEALVTTDLDEARRFVRAELGPLAGDADLARRLAETLRVFLEEGSSYVRAARRLGVHENKVNYRVRRAEELLGRRVGERQLELRMALRLARSLLPVPPS
jgi:DNA-binding PucR family transcriptional regulator